MKKILMALIPLIVSLQVPSWDATRLPADWVDTLQYGKQWVKMMYYASSAETAPVAEASLSGTVSAGRYLPKAMASALSAHLTHVPTEFPSHMSLHLDTQELELEEHKLIFVQPEWKTQVHEALKNARKELIHIKCELKRKAEKKEVLKVPDIRAILSSV